MTLQDFLKDWRSDSDTISVQSSGSTGTPKVFQVEKKRMLASAKMTCDFLHIQPGEKALLCMSLDHIGAQMMVVRSIERNLQLIEESPSGHPLANIDEKIDFAAMVPLQIYNSLQVASEKEKLKQIRNIIIGGGAIPKAMEEELRDFPNAIWSSYGMTETLSHIALRAISGEKATEWYTPLEGIKIAVNQEGCLCINAPMLCAEELVTNDIARINERGEFKIIGRRDNVINSGGIKIQIEEVEKALEESEQEIAIGSYPDEKFGQIIVLLTTQQDLSITKEAVGRLPKYWQPKRIFHVGQIPRTSNGKIAREEVQKEIEKQINHETHP